MAKKSTAEAETVLPKALAPAIEALATEVAPTADAVHEFRGKITTMVLADWENSAVNPFTSAERVEFVRQGITRGVFERWLRQNASQSSAKSEPKKKKK